MEFRKLNKGEKIKLGDLCIDAEIVDGTVRSLFMAAKDGSCIKIVATYYGNALEITVPKEPEMVERWYVVGNVIGLSVNEYYEEEYKANDRKCEIENLSGKATVHKVRVMLSDDGNVISGSGTLSADDEVPF